MKARVAIVGTRPERVREDYRRLFTLLGDDLAPSASDGLLLVCDCPSGRFVPGASSPPWQLDGALAALAATNGAAAELLPVAAGAGDARAARQHYHYDALLRSRDLDLHGAADEPLALLRPRTRLRRLTRFFPEGIPVSQLMLGRDAILLPTLRGDRLAPAGGAVAVAPDAVVARRLPPAWRGEAEIRADLLALRRELHPRLAVLADLTVVGFGAKLRSLHPVGLHMLLAGADPVALDAVAVRLLGFDPMAVDYLRACHDRALGTARTDEIDLVGQPELLDDTPRFYDPSRVRSDQVADLGRQLPPLLQTYPAAARLGRWRRRGSERLWWQLVGRNRRRRFVATPWGRLFVDYAAPRPAEGGG